MNAAAPSNARSTPAESRCRSQGLPVPEHEWRGELHAELHARPPEKMEGPLCIAHFVMLCSPAEKAQSQAHLNQLLTHAGRPPIAEGAAHTRQSFDTYRLRWELHGEFVTWTFSAPILDDRALQGGTEHTSWALKDVPPDWLQALPGRALTGMHLFVLSELTGSDDCAYPLARQLLEHGTISGCRVAGGKAQVFSDFSIQSDGFSRLVLVEWGLSVVRLGRLVQRLIEMETYRMLGLLALPPARANSDAMSAADRELANLSAQLQRVGSGGPSDEAALLQRLTHLACQVESQYAATHARYSASTAYFELMDKRLQDLNEQPMPGLQSISKFMARRVTPARSTCTWAQHRQEAMSVRISRVGAMLRARVDVAQQQQNQALLAAMSARQGLQLRLQRTVEGLSVAAITYYIVGLLKHMGDLPALLGLPSSATLPFGAVVPVVALGVAYAIRRVHQQLFTS